MTTLLHLCTRFVLFWYDFIVGDAWEVAAGVVVALVIAWVVVRAAPSLAGLLGPLLAVVVVGLTAASVWQEQRRHAK